MSKPKVEWDKMQATTVEVPAIKHLDENGVWTVIVKEGVLGPFIGLGTGHTEEEAKAHCLIYLRRMVQATHDGEKYGINN